MSVEREVRRALWTVAAVKSVRAVIEGVEGMSRAFAGICSDVEDAIWMVEADAGRRYEALTGVNLVQLANVNEADYNGYSEEFSTPYSEEDDDS